MGAGAAVRPVRVVVAGVNGYGRHHLENVRRLAAAGRAEPAGVCDLRPPAGLGVPVSADLPALIRETGAEIAVIATPIHTHAPLAVAALRAGAHVLLEKPPAPSAAEFEEISAAVAETGLACQVGFQSLGSEAVRAARDVLGEPLRGIGVAGAWTRPFGYYTRSAWAGRRRLDGVDVMDGALTNPFAHAVASALAVAGADTMDSVAGIELELHRANAIESDDTSSARIRLAGGVVVAVTVSLCADRRTEPYLHLHGATRSARLFYTVDEIEMDGVRTGFGRADLLENLVTHVREGTGLLVPLARTGGFTRLLDAIRLAPDPRPVEGRFVRTEPARLVLPGIEDLAVRAARELATLGELGFPGSLGSLSEPWPETVLRVGGQEVATYVQRGDLQATDAPRPHLHPVRTLGGTVVTEVQPDDHVHHFGAGIAIADVDGVNFWGGSTYVRGEGPAMLRDHGRQRRRTLRPAGGGYEETLDWVGPDGTVLAAEQRTLSARPVTGAWALDVAFTLTGRTGRPLVLQSSACKGRTGAGYGGFFWRAPKDSAGLEAFTGEASGEEAVHGSVTRWLALASDAWTLVFVQTAGLDPWFVRVAQYPGVGPALAWEEPLTVPGRLDRAITVVVADGRLTPDRARGLAGEAAP
ncbi:PmoA family protein [Actinomadura madurae]